MPPAPSRRPFTAAVVTTVATVALVAVGVAMVAMLAACGPAGQAGNGATATPTTSTPTTSSPATPCPATTSGAAALARDLFDLSNGEREAQGLPPLEWSDCQARKAAQRAQPFVTNAQLSHAPLVSSCHEGVTAGENLSRAPWDAPTVVDAWMGSAGHRANILNPAFGSSGVACLPAADGIYACSQLFEGGA